MSVDREYKIRISTVADNSAAQQAAQGLKDVGNATEQAGEHAKLFNTHSREMHKIIHELDHIVPGLGLSLRAAFSASNIGLAATLIILNQIYESFKRNAEAVKELNEVIARGADYSDYSKSLEDMGTAMDQTAGKAGALAESLRQIEAAETTLAQKAQDAVSLIQQEAAADLAKAEAKKQSLMAEIKAKEALGQLTKREAETALAELDSTSEKQANARKQKARLDEIAELQRAQEKNRSDASAATPAALDAASAAEQAKQNSIRRNFVVDQAKKALDENAKGSVASDLKEKSEAYDKMYPGDRWTTTEGAALRSEIASLTRLKAQAESQLAKYGSPESQKQFTDAEKNTKDQAEAAAKKATQLEDENQALIKQIRDLQNANAITTGVENATSSEHDKARAQTSRQNAARETGEAFNRDVTRAQRDIDEINRFNTKDSVNPEEIAKARAAVQDLHAALKELPGLLATLKQLGAPAAALQKQIDDLNKSGGRAGL